MSDGDFVPMPNSGYQNAKKLSVLIVAYNSRAHITECITSVIGASQGLDCEILLIDNGPDGTAAYVAEQFPEVRIVASQGNVGFAQGNNLLASAASQGEWLLLVNPDTRMFPDSIHTLLAAAAHHPEFAALGGVNIGPDGEPLAITTARLPKPSELFLRAIGKGPPPFAYPETPEVLPVEVLCGGFLMIKREVWDRIRGFDSSFFLYAEELDLFRRLKDKGYRSALVPDSRIFHDVGGGVSISPTRIFYQVVGNAHYIRKHFAAGTKTICLGLLWASAMARYSLASVRKRSGQKDTAVRESFAVPALKPWKWWKGFSSAGADPRKAS